MTIPAQISFRAPLVTLLLCLLTGTLILAIGNWQTRQLADKESSRLGQALAAQLVETVRQPILHNDLVSLQVYVERLVKHTEVAGAAIYTPQQKQIAQSSDSRNHLAANLVSYREPIIIEDKTVAFAGVDIDIAILLARYRAPLNWVLLIWLLFTAAITTLVAVSSRNYGNRLKRLYTRLPGDDTYPLTDDELAQLEQRLEPLLTHNVNIDESEKADSQIATVALHCKNLERLEAQLSRDNLQRLLNQLDEDLEQVCTLYQGHRQPGRDHTLFIEFDGDLNGGDHPLRSLFAAYLLLELADSHAQSLGVGLELSAAARLSQSQPSTSLLGDFEREKRETEVLRLVRLAERGEILLDSSTRLHPMIESSIDSELISESSDIHRVKGFSPAQATLLEKQLTYLKSL